MSMHFRDLAEQAVADGAISPDEILALRRAGWSNGKIEPDEAEAIFLINQRLSEPPADWSDFFVEALSEFIVNGTEPKGYVSDSQGDWLISRVDVDGRLDSMTELELLVKVLEKAHNAPDTLKRYALAQVEQAVLTGQGPTRDGGTLAAGCITEAETRLLRRIIFAEAGDRPAAVSRSEAEMLFRLKDAVLSQANAPEWKRLFVQGVGNFLQGFGSHDPLSRDRAAELEHFVKDANTNVGGFLARTAKASINGGFAIGLRQLFGPRNPGRDYDGEAAEAHAVTSDEQAWLDGRINGDGRIDEYEQALLDFLAEE